MLATRFAFGDACFALCSLHFSKRCAKIPVMFRHQESQLGVTIAWILGPLWGTAAGFYLGTIWSQVPMTTDLNTERIAIAAPFALLGLVLGIIFAIVVTVVYPKAIDREYALEAEHDHHH